MLAKLTGNQTVVYVLKYLDRSNPEGWIITDECFFKYEHALEAALYNCWSSESARIWGVQTMIMENKND